MFLISVLIFLTAVGGVWPTENVTVIRQRLEFDQEYTYVVRYNTEYVLEFIPSIEDIRWPSRVWVSVDGGDTLRPLLITYRQTAGAGTWQLPYYVGEGLQYQLERTLCPDDSTDEESAYCGGDREARGEFSLHVVSACTAPLVVRLRAHHVRNWLLPFDNEVTARATLTAPMVNYYRFHEGQMSVRLQLTSEDDVCSVVAIQNYSCPIYQMASEFQTSTTRMTVQRSGAVHIPRSRYPIGFYVIVVVLETDTPCTGDEPTSDDWLWQVAMGGELLSRVEAPREKQLSAAVRPALSRSQYVIAAAVTLAVFLGFYVIFGIFVLMQRWPVFGQHVWPKAVLAKNLDQSEAQVDSEYPDAELPERNRSRSRRRRGSDATFDSSDNSDSDEELPTMTTTAAATPADIASPATIASPADPASPAEPASPVSSVPPADRGTNRVDVADGSANGVWREHDGQTDSEQVQNGNARGSQRGAGGGAGGGAGPAAEAGATPFGLPAQLRLAALSRRRARVLQARSDRYLHTVATVAVFYALPVVQFVIAFQIFMNVSGALDLCYYNFLCAHPAGELNDFNHVFSNIGYLLLGLLFLLQLWRRMQGRKKAPRDEEYGIPAHYGLLSSLGVSMMVVALLSASYHICPNQLNFQFDTAFMYVMAVLAMVKIYQARHPDVNARAHATFGVLAVLIAFGVWGVLGGGALFWAVFTVVHVFTFLLLTLRIYYIGQFRLEKESLQMAARELQSLPSSGIRPLYTARLILLLIANAVNWAFALYGLLKQSANFASHLLNLLLCNTLLYMIFYMVMKFLHGERPRWYVWCFLVSALATWAPALYFFMSGSSSWSSTPAQSRHLNHECYVLEFYDSHDLWHMLSAIALYLSFNTLLTWDDGLAAVKRTEIAVF